MVDERPTKPSCAADSRCASTRHLLPPALLAGLFLAVGAIVFWHQAFRRDYAQGDILAHNRMVISSAADHSLPTVYFLYHLLVWVASGFSGQLDALGVAAVGVLTASLVARALASHVWLTQPPVSAEYASGKVAAIAAGLSLAMPLQNWWQSGAYLGQFTPNVWHNPTLVLAMPFTIVLFASAMRSLESASLRVCALTSVMLVLQAVAKPSYLLPFIPVYLAAFVWSQRARLASRTGRLSAAVVISGVFGPILLVLIAQYFVAFSAHTGAGMTVRPFAVWRLYSPNLVASLALSLAFPAVALAVTWRSAVRDSAFMIAWAVFALALLEFVLLAEVGAAFSAGNFFWGSFAALFILFMTGARRLLVAPPHGWRSLVAWGALWAHVVSGLAYLVYLFVTSEGF